MYARVTFVQLLPDKIDEAIGIYYLLVTWLSRRNYLMFPCCVAEEVRACLEQPEGFLIGPSLLKPYMVCDSN